MFLVMLKKELKMFFRSKGNVMMLFLFPIVLITTLSLSLNNIMSAEVEIFGENDKDSMVYYSVNEDSKYKDGFLMFTEEIEKEINIEFKEVDALDEVRANIDEKKAIAYVSLYENNFDIYTSKNGDTMKSKVFKSMLESLFNKYGAYETIAEFNPEALRSLVENTYDEYVVSEDVNGKRTVTAAEYYTFAELALIILNLAGVIGELVYKEKQLNTINRIKMSKASERTMIFSKIALGTIISILQTLLVYIYTTLILKVNWGENTLKFILLFVVFGLFSSMLGAIVGIACKTDTATGGILSGATFVICALGGSYSTRSMITTVPVLNKLMYLSPIYWINTATSTMICGLESNLYLIAIMIPIILSFLLLIFYSVVMKKKGGTIDV
ncbi:ABC-2 type transporter [Clostridium bornimense]|uniref:ABC-2 type transporter n=1 Tax=Clostridium bornimense TaxID=1216932 RepID=W6RZI2_9CLOT|nr:ABC transporter permease [Clostridium bornimense]CDM70066.1 ABC-2 type transporter [Clostridium bornimense]